MRTWVAVQSFVETPPHFCWSCYFADRFYNPMNTGRARKGANDSQNNGSRNLITVTLATISTRLFGPEWKDSSNFCDALVHREGARLHKLHVTQALSSLATVAGRVGLSRHCLLWGQTATIRSHVECQRQSCLEVYCRCVYKRCKCTDTNVLT